MTAALRVVALGVGEAFSALHYSTSLALVAADGRWLLLDCPHPIRKVVHEASLASGVDLRLSNLVGAAVTHLHADHASGLEGLGAYLKYVAGRTEKLPLYLGPTVFDLFQRRSEHDLFDSIRLEGSREAGPFTLDARPTDHGKTPAYAFRVSAGGRRFGHSGDTRFDPELIRWLAEADLFVHEVGSGEDENPKHTPYRKLAALPESVRAKMRLAHYLDGFDLDQSVIEPLRQGWVYEV